jgi:hypothetical protein
MKRIGLIGAGTRTKDYNLPILELMSDRLEIVGVTTKSGKLREGVKVDAPVFESITKMIEETKPDALIVSIKSNLVMEVLDEVIESGLPFVIETTDNTTVYSKLSSKEAKAGILEQWPFLPLEQFKKQLINSGALGQILSVENDYRTYDYHGAAQLRNYLPDTPPPKLVSIKTLENRYNSEFYVDANDNQKMPALETLRAKIGFFENGTLLVYKFSDKHKTMPFRNFKSLKIMGSRGSVNGDCLLDKECKISVLDDEGNSHDLEIFYRYNEGFISAISCTLPDGRVIEWENKYGKLSEHQIATAYLFDEMIIKDNLFYSPDSALEDMIISYARG